MSIGDPYKNFKFCNGVTCIVGYRCLRDKWEMFEYAGRST